MAVANLVNRTRWSR